MADYIAAFKQGLAAAEEAQFAMREIDEVFATLNREAQVASEGKIAIERRKCEDRSSPKAVLAAISSEPVITYWSIVAYNPTVPNGHVKELSKWEQNRHGYPCKISWENVVLYCEDKESLEKALQELLADPIVGKKLSGLMGLETPPPPMGSLQNDAHSCAP